LRNAKEKNERRIFVKIGATFSQILSSEFYSTMAAEFEISAVSAPQHRRTLSRFDLTEHIKPKNRLRWEYLRESVPHSVLDNLSLWVLKATVDGCYGLSAGERRDLKEFAKYLATLPDFKLQRLGRQNSFVQMVRDERRQLAAEERKK
jgi:hypothetical protein